MLDKVVLGIIIVNVVSIAAVLGYEAWAALRKGV
jgi:hypothetical protein